MQPRRLAAVRSRPATSRQAEQLPTGAQQVRGGRAAPHQVVGQWQGCFQVPLDLEIPPDIGLRNREIVCRIPERAPQGLGMFNNKAEKQGAGLRRPLTTVPK